MSFRFCASFVVVATIALAGCASSTEGPGSDDSFATSGSDQEIARIGGDGAWTVGDDGAYFVFDRGLFRVDASGTKERLADAPEKAGDVVVSGNFIVVEASPVTGNKLVFYDRTKGFEAKTVALDFFPGFLLPAADGRVLLTSFDHGLDLYAADGETKSVLPKPKLNMFRDLQRGKTENIVYATLEHSLVEIDVAKGKTRVVREIPQGSFAYAYDATTDTFFCKRGHVTLPSQDVLETFDQDGKVLATLETPLNSFEAPIADADGFYLAARPGRSPGVGSWKLFAFDKTTLAMTERGRVEPQVFHLALQGKTLFYSHGKDAATPLRVRPL